MSFCKTKASLQSSRPQITDHMQKEQVVFHSCQVGDSNTSFKPFSDTLSRRAQEGWSLVTGGNKNGAEVDGSVNHLRLTAGGTAC